ncbi:MAG: sialate O-acetylesterase, partial [Prevotella sp.]|nr:sialate O-acetylesterase [Prevotella sp.]
MRRYLYLLLFTLLPLMSLSAKGKEQAPASIIRVACVGNSVTYGYGLQDPATQSYPTQLQQLLGDKYEVRNFGHSGATLLSHGHRPYIKEPEFRQALDFKADLVVIHLGLNDTDPRNWPDHADEFIGDYRALIDSFRVANPNARIWICLMTPIFHNHPRFQSGTRDWHAAIQKEIYRVATYNVGLIDLNTPLYNHPELFPDALHPNVEGAGIIARTVYGALTGDYGELKPSAMYGNGMVVQRQQPIEFHGTFQAGSEVRVTFNDSTIATNANERGQWSVTFPKMEAGGPYRLSFSTGVKPKRGMARYGLPRYHEITFDSVYVGEVWLCSGQSNMEFTLNSTTTAQQDRDLFHHPSSFISYCDLSTLYPTDHVEWSEAPLDSVNHLRLLHQPRWQACTPENVGNFSAIAVHFGRVLADSLRIPIGIICNAVGGTTTESWIDRRTLEWEFPNILYDWYHADYGQAWARGRALKNIAKAPNTKLQRHPYEPAYMFEAGIL